MKMTPDLWNVLHDGEVRGVSGKLPGDVQLDVDIGYLRSRFPEPGDKLFVSLHGCTVFSHQPYECDAPLTDFSEIAAALPSISRAADWTDATVVDCHNGVMRVQAEGFSLTLDSAHAITFDELCAACEAYWRGWAEPSSKVIP